VKSITLAAQGNFTRGTGPQTITSKLVVKSVPVASGAVLQFETLTGLSYRALLYELHDKATGAVSNISPNWFGVALPNAFHLSQGSNVYVLVYFHPRPFQAKYKDEDYFAKKGSPGGADWKQLYAYVDRLGGQMAGAIQKGALANRIVVFPFLKQAQYTLPTSEWFNIIHDILKDIDTNLVTGICSHPKKIIVGTLSNGTVYLEKFLTEASTLPVNSNIIEAWDFDTDIVSGQDAPLKPHDKRFRAYWQGNNVVHPNTKPSTYIKLPTAVSWINFPDPPPNEVPPLPPKASNSVSGPDTTAVDKIHHYIRDTMFLDAVFNIEADNP
jgi:hypothetical protein